VMDSKQHKYWAEITLKALVERIRNFDGGDKYITYGNLAKAIGYPKPHTGNLFGYNIGSTLGVMGHLIENIVIDGQKPPLIQAMVVNSKKKLPSDGLKEFNNTYPSLSDQKKKDFAYAEYRRIFEFGDRWERVLRHLKIDIPNPQKENTFSTERGLYNPYGSEGSPEHRALRDYIADNPAEIGLSKSTKRIIEYPLKSGDSVDIVFITEKK
jgi:hypothetical protein